MFYNKVNNTFILLIILIYMSESGNHFWLPYATGSVNNSGSGLAYGFVANGLFTMSEKWRFVAAILTENQGQFYQQCGGSLVSDIHVLTAAHCLIQNGTQLETKQIIIRLGQYDLRLKGHDFKVNQIYIYPDYNNQTFANDIAVLRLEKVVDFHHHMEPIPMAMSTEKHQFERSDVTNSEIASIAGWGRTSATGDHSDDLLEAQLHIVPQSDCQLSYKKHITINKSRLCATAPLDSLSETGESMDACKGDSGGPLIQYDESSEQYYLTGVVSFGKKCATYGAPGVYSSVEYYSKWITDIIDDKTPNS